MDKLNSLIVSFSRIEISPSVLVFASIAVVAFALYVVLNISNRK